MRRITWVLAVALLYVFSAGVATQQPPAPAEQKGEQEPGKRKVAAIAPVTIRTPASDLIPRGLMVIVPQSDASDGK